MVRNTFSGLLAFSLAVAGGCSSSEVEQTVDVTETSLSTEAIDLPLSNEDVIDDSKFDNQPELNSPDVSIKGFGVEDHLPPPPSDFPNPGFGDNESLPGIPGVDKDGNPQLPGLPGIPQHGAAPTLPGLDFDPSKGPELPGLNAPGLNVAPPTVDMGPVPGVHGNGLNPSQGAPNPPGQKASVSVEPQAVAPTVAAPKASTSKVSVPKPKNASPKAKAHVSVE